MQGACVFGMTAAMHSGITFENGAVEQNNFHDYPMVRADNFPETVHVHIVEHPFSVHATGVGEPGVPPVHRGARQRHRQRQRQAHPQSAGWHQPANGLRNAV